MKILIINADDLGLSEGVNEAVMKCLNAGVVTGVSMMASGRCFKEAAEMLKSSGHGEVGAHLTLTGALPPVTEDVSKISTILDADGFFYKGYMPFAKRYFSGKVDAGHIYEEFRAQVEAILACGLRVTHLDSHEHIHALPGIFRVTMAIARDLGIKYVRVPSENVLMLFDRFSLKDALRYCVLKPFAVVSKMVIRNVKLVSNEAFLGHARSGRIDDKAILHMADRLSPGINELAVHLAVPDARLVEESPWHAGAEAEMDVLMNGKWKAALEDKGIDILPHTEAMRRVGII